MKTNSDYAGKYSEDRISLAQEIRETLEVRGYNVPNDWASSDLIGAVARALDRARRLNPNSNYRAKGDSIL